MSVVAEIRSPPVTLHGLLSGWQTEWTSFLALAAILGFGLVYLLGVRRLASRGRRWSPARTASFLTGLVVVELATGSGIASYDDSVFTMHVVQHMMLMNAAPPLLALGAPISLLLQASRRTTTTRVLKLLHSRVVDVLTQPLVVLLVGISTMYCYFLTPLYQLSLNHPLFHNYTHLHFLLAGCLFWWPVVGRDPIPHRLSFPARMAFLGISIPSTAFLGVALLNQVHPIATQHTLADTHTGGGVLWGFTELFTVAALAVIFVQWMREEDRKAAREDRRLEALANAQAAVEEAAASLDRSE